MLPRLKWNPSDVFTESPSETDNERKNHQLTRNYQKTWHWISHFKRFYERDNEIFDNKCSWQSPKHTQNKMRKSVESPVKEATKVIKPHPPMT